MKKAQLAPSCQVTESNARRVHGGSTPPYLSYFKPDNREIIYDKKQSEQGMRFYRKLNRNILVLTKQKIPLQPSHKWIEVRDLLYFLHSNYLVNTDARSILACSPWETLVGRRPFAANKRGFGAQLLTSFVSQNNYQSLDSIKKEIKIKRAKIKEPKIIRLSRLSSWRLGNKGLWPKNHQSFAVKQIKVKISSREVSDWDQPIIDSFCPGQIILVCARRKGVLHFLFQASAEPGLYNKVELTPTIIIEPGEKKDKIKSRFKNGRIVVDCRQSEEGARFFRDVNHFLIINQGEVFKPQSGYFWLTLRQIRQLLDEEGWFTNEARSVISMLLYWL